MTSIIYALVLGTISGMLWGSTFGFTLRSSALVGGIVGIVFGLFLVFVGKMAKTGGRLVQGEINFVNFSNLTAIGLLSIISGFIAFTVKYIFGF